MQSLKPTQVKQSGIHDALAVRPKLPAAAAATAQTEPEDGADAEGGRKGGDRYSVCFRNQENVISRVEVNNGKKSLWATQLPEHLAPSPRTRARSRAPSGSHVCPT